MMLPAQPSLELNQTTTGKTKKAFFAVDDWDALPEGVQRINKLQYRFNLMGLIVSVLLAITVLFISTETKQIIYAFTGIPIIVVGLFLMKNQKRRVGMLAVFVGALSTLVVSSFLFPGMCFELLFIPLGVTVLLSLKRIDASLLLFAVVFSVAVFVLLFNHTSLTGATGNLSFVLLVPFMLLFTAVIVVQYRKTTEEYKSELVVSKMKEEYQRTVIEEISVRNILLERQQHQNELRIKEQDLEKLRANNAVKIKIRKNIIQQLKKIESNSTDPNKAIKSLIAELSGQLSSENKIGILEENIGDVGAEFNSKIQNLFPSLSKSELELCSFLKLEISSKEIASIRNTTPGAVYTSTKRIRNKMKVTSNAELLKVLQLS